MYKALIDRQLSFAFKSLKDLALDVEFTNASSEEFDFSQNEASLEEDPNKMIKAVVLEIEEDQKKRQTKEKRLMFKTKDLGEVGAYSRVKVEGKTFKLLLPTVSSGYITLVRISEVPNG